MAQPLALGRRARSRSSGIGRDRLDLGELVAEEVEVALARALALAQLGQLGARAARTRGAPRGSARAAPGARRRRSRRGSRAGPRRSSACGARAGRRRRAGGRRAASGRRPRRRGRRRRRWCGRRPRPGARARPPRRPPAAARRARPARARRAGPRAGRRRPRPRPPRRPGRTICGRALPPISRSSEWARTVLPAPVSPVIAFRPAPSRSSARSISSRFSIRSSRSTGSV